MFNLFNNCQLSRSNIANMTTHLVETQYDPITAVEIEGAYERISNEINRTPLRYSERLSKETGCEVFLKCEELQNVRSYKIRGAINSIQKLNDEERKAGIVTASAGNHAQGVAYACRTMGIRGKIFVPEPTPAQKRNRIMAHGGDFVELVVVGESFDDAAAAAHEDAEKRGATFVEPFDARDTVEGQGTIALEIMEQLENVGKKLDVIISPVGGGGLISGLTSYLAEKSPETQIYGVEPHGAASLAAALKHGGPFTLPKVDPFVDGAAVRRLGDLPYQVISANINRIKHFDVLEDDVCVEMLGLYQNEGIVSEPAGALSVAGLRQLDLEPGSTVVCVISGGNNDVVRYSEIMERALVHEGLKHYFLVSFPQVPGQLRRFLDEVLSPGDDITRFEYVKRNNCVLGTALVGIVLEEASHLPKLIQRFEKSKFEYEHLVSGTPEYKIVG